MKTFCWDSRSEAKADKVELSQNFSESEFWSNKISVQTDDNDNNEDNDNNDNDDNNDDNNDNNDNHVNVGNQQQCPTNKLSN